VWSPFALAVPNPRRSVASRAFVKDCSFIIAVAVLPSKDSPIFLPFVTALPLEAWPHSKVLGIDIRNRGLRPLLPP